MQREPAGELESNLTADLEANLQAQLDAGIRQTTGAAMTATLDPAAEPMTIEDVQGGGRFWRWKPTRAASQCAGYVHPQPTLSLTVPQGTALVGIVFEHDGHHAGGRRSDRRDLLQ